MKTLTQSSRANEETLLIKYLINRVEGQASGRLQKECLFDLPRDKFFIGNLRPSGEASTEVGFLKGEIMRKIAPVAFGGDFLLKPDFEKIRVEITLSWACYYRVFPTFQEQQLLLKQDEKENDLHTVPNLEIERVSEENEGDIKEQEGEYNAANEERKNRKSSKQKDALCPKFRKISCVANGEILIQRSPRENTWSIDDSLLRGAVEQEINRAIQLLVNDPETCKSNSDIDAPIKIPIAAVSTEEVFKSTLNQFLTHIIPQWKWNVQVKMEKRTGMKGEVLTIMFENASPMPDKSSSREGYFFEIRAAFKFDKDVVIPFELELAPKGFRYNRHLWARGFNCAIIKENEFDYVTTNTPIHTQNRYDTRSEPKAPFVALANNPVPILRQIHQAMKNYLSEWDLMENNFKNQYGEEWLNFRDEYLKDRKYYENEIDRFGRGLALIEGDSKVQLAFKLTNETFHRTGQHPTKPKTSWRLFQIVFLVTQIPGIKVLDSRPTEENFQERLKVDIVYFPTGGGKTEAYLGVLVFHCFFDRLRGKTAGVTAWLRFPLRLLTLQQTQRMADVIGVAELVRMEQTDERLSGKVTGFGVGYFVGQSSSPNKLNSNPSRVDDQIAWSKAIDPGEREKWKRVVSCPSCRTKSVTVDLDEERVRIIHRCTNKNCLFPEGKIPIYIVDNEVYRYLPSVIVGTIDKLAGLGNQRQFSMILGAVTGICNRHGYLSGKCCQPECKDEKQWQKGKIPPGLSGPTLFIQDELHLLREGLGTFDSHYETFVQKLLTEMGQTSPLKIIASSATIEAFERQVEHLYGRKREDARVFPGVGPSITKSFYAETKDYPQRLFLGVIPHNKTIFNSILELLEYYHSEIQSLSNLRLGSPNPYNGQIQPGTDIWRDLIDHYLTSLTYFLATRELSSIRTDLETHVNSNLESEGYQPLNIAELTGSTSTSEVANILEKVEKPCEPEQPNTILATSMVSHGVDIDRFNSMLFYGMPRQNAEYIQASSRVGRSHVGLVIICLHPIRERDQSHFNYFIKFHEFLGQMVEPVAINRWSKFSIERTLPGLFMSVLLQLIANESGEANPNNYYMLDFVKKKIGAGEITPNHFIPLLKDAYQVAGINAPAENHFSQEIELRIKQFLDQISGASSTSIFVSEALFPPPMRSLRDVDEAIEIELDDLGSRWASK